MVRLANVFTYLPIVAVTSHRVHLSLQGLVVSNMVSSEILIFPRDVSLSSWPQSG